MTGMSLGMDMSMVIHKQSWLFFYFSAILLIVTIILKFIVRLRFPTDDAICRIVNEACYNNTFTGKLLKLQRN